MAVVAEAQVERFWCLPRVAVSAGSRPRPKAALAEPLGRSRRPELFPAIVTGRAREAVAEWSSLRPHSALPASTAAILALQRWRTMLTVQPLDSLAWFFRDFPLPRRRARILALTARVRTLPLLIPEHRTLCLRDRGRETSSPIPS